MAEFPVLITPRLALRAFRPTDAAAVYAIFSREAVTRYVNRETMRSMQEADELVAVRASVWQRNLGARWAITLRGGDDTVIGSCGYYNVDRANCCVEIGYDLHPARWRQGIMTEALTAMLDYCYGATFAFRLNRVLALTELDNVASMALLCKLGFQDEGVRRECGYWRNVFHDLRGFSLLRREWEARLVPAGNGERARGSAGAQSAAAPAARSVLRGWIL